MAQGVRKVVSVASLWYGDMDAILEDRWSSWCPDLLLISSYLGMFSLFWVTRRGKESKKMGESDGVSETVTNRKERERERKDRFSFYSSNSWNISSGCRLSLQVFSQWSVFVKDFTPIHTKRPHFSALLSLPLLQQVPAVQHTFFRKDECYFTIQRSLLHQLHTSKRARWCPCEQGISSMIL